MIRVYRNNIAHTMLNLTKGMVCPSSLMGEHKIEVSGYRVPKTIDLQIGDYMVHKDVRYTINTVPNYTKIEHTTQHQYDLIFEHPIYKLYDKILMFEGETEFPYFGTPSDYIDLILSSINEIDPGWLKGQVDETDEQHIDFSNVSCRVALTNVAEAFGMEFYCSGDGKRLNLVAKVGVDRNITLQHGKGKGLYTLSRSYVEDKNVVTRVYGIGGVRNLPKDYTKTSLQLPEPLEANIDLYGIKEGIYKNEDIFPTRIGTVTSVTPHDPKAKFNKLVDADLDFDINDYLAAGLTAKIGFQNGELAGYEFEITEYKHDTKTITYLTNTDTSTGLVMPNESFQAKAGDKYKLLDIYLPQSYVDDALYKLEEGAQEYLEESKFPRVAYDLKIDVLHFKRNGYVLNPGDRIRIIDTDISLDHTIRVTSVSYPLAFYEDDTLWSGMEYSVELANDFIPYTVQERIQIEQREQKKEIIEQGRLSKHTQAALEEIARAAAINQFERTYIGQLAILTGALVVGNPELGAVAGVSGLEDLLTAIRFFAGSDFENRDTAPFRVNQAGQLWATDANISGVINALEGMIGFLKVDANSLTLGKVEGDNDPWTPGMNVVNFYRDYFLYRKNGDIRGQIRELTYNLYSNRLGSFMTEASRSTNTISNTEGGSGVNIAHSAFASNADINIGVRSNAAIIGASVVSTGLYSFSPSTGNVIQPKSGTNVSCYMTNPDDVDIFFPNESDLRIQLVLSETDYCIPFTITNQFNSTQTLRLRPFTGQKIRYRSSGFPVERDFISIAPSETRFFQVIKSGSEQWVQMLTIDIN